MPTETATNIAITAQDESEAHPNYCHYASQSSPQDGQIILDCESGELWADYNGEIGNGMPLRQWHGHLQVWRVSPYASGSQLNTLMADLRPAMQRIVNGYTSEWNGSNHVARFSEDAEDAKRELDENNSGGWLGDGEPCNNGCSVCYPEEGR